MNPSSIIEAVHDEIHALQVERGFDFKTGRYCVAFNYQDQIFACW